MFTADDECLSVDRDHSELMFRFKSKNSCSVKYVLLKTAHIWQEK